MTSTAQADILRDRWETFQRELSTGILDILGQGAYVKPKFGYKLVYTGEDRVFQEPSLAIEFGRTKQKGVYALVGNLGFPREGGAFGFAMERSIPEDDHNFGLGCAPEGEYVLSGRFPTPSSLKLLQIPQPEHVVLVFKRYGDGEEIVVKPVDHSLLAVEEGKSVLSVSAPWLARRRKRSRLDIVDAEDHCYRLIHDGTGYYSFCFADHDRSMMPGIDPEFITDNVKVVSPAGIPITGEDFPNVPLYGHPQINIESGSFCVTTYEYPYDRTNDTITVSRKMPETPAGELIEAVGSGKTILDLTKY